MSELRQLMPTVTALDLSAFTGAKQRIGQRQDVARRAIETFEAECTVSEDHDDELTITEHPVEHGAAIADHAFKRPSEVRCRIGWTASYVGGDVAQIYEQILALQASREPFGVITGKRVYQNMLVASIRTQTNSGLAYTFLADVVLRQIIRVSTQTIPISSNVSELADIPNNMPTATMGTVNPNPASLSFDQIVAATGDTAIAEAAAVRRGYAAELQPRF
ncbi:MAG: hypothetical protein C5B60_02475 [Chloroflexi bacterium]|nr:MAG: hypothetical protein C5B60_02475 [Chloroflexota bacterium]